MARGLLFVIYFSKPFQMFLPAFKNEEKEELTLSTERHMFSSSSIDPEERWRIKSFEFL